MAYDFDGVRVEDWLVTLAPIEPLHPQDLEAIVMLLELAAIYLTPAPGAVFTFDDLLARAQQVGGLPIEERDARIVLNHSKFVRPVGGDSFVLR